MATMLKMLTKEGERTNDYASCYVDWIDGYQQLELSRAGRT